MRSHRYTVLFPRRWPRGNGARTPGALSSLKKGKGTVQQVIACLGPVDARVAPEPGLLAAGEAAGRPDGLVPGLLKGPVAVKVAQHLLVAQGAAGGLAVAQPV